VCRREITLFITYTLRAEKTEGVCDDLSDYTTCYTNGEFIQNFAVTVGNMTCIVEGSCTDPAEFEDDPVNPAYAGFGGIYYGRGCGPEPLVGNEEYAQFTNFVGFDYSEGLTDPNHEEYYLVVPLYRYMNIRSGGVPTLHEIAIGSWVPTTAEETTGLQTRSTFEQFWCYALYNQGIDCLTDADTQSGFWTNVFKQVAKALGSDDQTSEFKPVWFSDAVYDLASIESAASVGPFYHSEQPLYWDLTDGVVVAQAEETLWKTWVIDDWKRMMIMQNDISVEDTILRFRSCEEFWRKDGAYFGTDVPTMPPSSICDASSLDSTTGGYLSYFNCTDSLGCMTENPTTTEAASLVSWTAIEAASNELWDSIVVWDTPQACVTYNDIVSVYYNVTNSYKYENIYVCYSNRVWQLDTWPVEDWSDVTYLPAAFNNLPTDADSGFSLVEDLVSPFDIYAFPEEVVEQWLYFGDQFDEVFSLAAIEFIESYEGDFDDFSLATFETEESDYCVYWMNREDYRNI